MAETREEMLRDYEARRKQHEAARLKQRQGDQGVFFTPSSPTTLAAQPSFSAQRPVQATAAGPQGPAIARDIQVTLPKIHQRVWDKLCEHDSDNPIKKGQIIEYLWPKGGAIEDRPEDPEREVRKMIEQLLREYGKLCGAGGRGYYAIHTEKDLKKAIMYLKSKELSMHDRCQLLETNYKIATGRALPSMEQELLALEGSKDEI